jgi:hypothetical protein
MNDRQRARRRSVGVWATRRVVQAVREHSGISTDGLQFAALWISLRSVIWRGVLLVVMCVGVNGVGVDAQLDSDWQSFADVEDRGALAIVPREAVPIRTRTSRGHPGHGRFGRSDGPYVLEMASELGHLDRWNGGRSPATERQTCGPGHRSPRPAQPLGGIGGPMFCCP